MKRAVGHTLRFAALLTTGACLNYVVAWACVLWSPDRPASKASYDDLAEQMGLPVEWDEALAAMEVRSIGYRSLRSGWPLLQVEGVDVPVQYRHLQEYSGRPGPLQLADVLTTTAGLPIHCLCHCTIDRPPHWSAASTTSGLPSIAPAPEFTTDDLAKYAGNWFVTHRRIPWTPIWALFVVNTCFYSALICLPTFGLPALKRRRRRQCEQCVACGYPVAGLAACPECATVSEPSTRADPNTHDLRTHLITGTPVRGVTP